MDKITVIIFKFEQISYEEYKNIPYSKDFSHDATIKDIEDWIKSVDPNKSIFHAYFSK